MANGLSGISIRSTDNSEDIGGVFRGGISTLSILEIVRLMIATMTGVSVKLCHKRAAIMFEGFDA